MILPIPVRRALRKLGHDIRDARRRRRIPASIAAERASISRTTLVKIEKGDPGVAMGPCYSSWEWLRGWETSQTQEMTVSDCSLKKSICRSGFVAREPEARVSNGQGIARLCRS